MTGKLYLLSSQLGIIIISWLGGQLSIAGLAKLNLNRAWNSSAPACLDSFLDVIKFNSIFFLFQIHLFWPYTKLYKYSEQIVFLI